MALISDFLTNQDPNELINKDLLSQNTKLLFSAGKDNE